jgi:diguanylate cyclase (GGDEF)-like protein/PAS domain S-box-containing protein
MTLPERIRLLLIEDVATDAELELRELKRAGLSVDHRVVDTEVQFRAALEQFAPHVIISDFSMPHFDGMAALALARELHPEIPFLFVSGTIGEEYAIRALKNGATDYVLKANLMRLPAALERALHEARERAAQRATERALETTRERLASIFHSLPDVVWSVALPARQLIYVSPAVAQVYGRTPREALANSDFWVDAIHPEDRERVMAEWPGSSPDKIHDSEYRIVRPDGAVRWVNVRRRVFTSAAGVPERVDGLVRDITDAVRQRERLARLGRIRDLLSAVNAAIVRVRDRQELFESFCRIAVERGGFLAARLVDFEPATGRLQIAVATDESRDSLLDVVDAYNRDPAGSKSLLALALRDGEAIVSNDAAADDRARQRDRFAREGVNSIACLPLTVEGKVTGAVVLRAAERGFFDEEEMRLLGDLTGNLAFALELVAKRQKLDYLAFYDPLTGLPNRTLFMERLTQALEAERRGNGSIALVLIDLERFKAINDALGQAVGDRVLQDAGRRLQEAAGDIHQVARLGGNLYALMFPDIAGAEEVARRLEQKSANAFGAPYQIDRHEIRIAAKAGIAVSPEDGADADVLFRNAEAALKRAKQTGERYVFYAPQINARVSEQVELENRLRKAVERRELFLHYQPKVDLATRKIVGLEALMRWRGPDGLLVSPARFIPMLEDTGMILEAGRIALEIASGVYRDWKARGLEAPRIAVNVSALQIRHKEFVDDVHSVIDGSDSGIDLEITESLLMQDVDASIRKLKSVREAGLNIALDDFGTGHSSLAYLSRLPIDTVKIDRSFVHGMLGKVEDTSIVTAIISLARALRLNVVAEGVESEEQARLLYLLRCDQMQGYLFSPPVDKDKVEMLLRTDAN